MPLTCFSLRSRSLSLCTMAGFGEYDDLFDRLGKHRTGVSCLYTNKLDDVDMNVLRDLVAKSYKHMQTTSS